jgi:uncharacterized protein
MACDPVSIRRLSAVSVNPSRESAIDLLLTAGARLDAKDMNGDSPLTWASWHLRPDSILRKLCYDGFSIRPERRSSYDHGVGWDVMGATKAHV